MVVCMATHAWSSATLEDSFSPRVQGQMGNIQVLSKITHGQDRFLLNQPCFFCLWLMKSDPILTGFSVLP